MEFLTQDTFNEVCNMKSAIAYLICGNDKLDAISMLHCKQNFLHYIIFADFTYHSKRGKQYLDKLTPQKKENLFC